MRNNASEKHILFLMPLVYRPYFESFSGRFNLPERFVAQIVAPSHLKFEGLKVGSATFHAVPLPDAGTRFPALRHLLRNIALGLRLHRERKVDVVYAYDPLTLGISGAILKVLTGARLVIEINGHLLTAGFIGGKSLQSILKRKLYEMLIGLTLRVSDCVKLVNKALIEEFRAFLREGRYRVFHDFVSTGFFTPMGNDDRYIFFAGHPFYLKGVDLLITAFKRVSTDFPDYRLLIMGFNNTDLEHYQAMAADCPRIQFSKPVLHNEIFPYFQNCSFFALPSRSDAMPRVLIEAMAAGKAVVASRVGGIPELVDDGKTGLLFESENADQLEQAMRTLLADPVLRRSMGKAASERVDLHFSQEVYMQYFVKLLDEA